MWIDPDIGTSLAIVLFRSVIPELRSGIDLIPIPTITEHLPRNHTEVISNGPAARQSFKIGAQLLVPAALAIDELRRDLGALANEMMVDVALGERAAAG